MKNIIKNSLFLATALLVIAGISYAALGDRLIDLIPNNTADKGGLTHSLNDIYDKLTGETSLSPIDPSYPNGDTSVIVQSFRTIEEVWDAVPDELTFSTSDLTVNLTPGILHTATSVSVDLPVGTIVPPGEWSTDTGSTYNWADANTYCANLTEGEHSVGYWRLPTEKEFAAINDYTRYNPTTQLAGFASSVNYWSSTECAHSVSSSWIWYSYNGNLSGLDKRGSYRVRCVH
jgi:hypothetical protein